MMKRRMYASMKNVQFLFWELLLKLLYKYLSILLSWVMKVGPIVQGDSHDWLNFGNARI